MADYTQSATQNLLAHQAVLLGANAIGTAVDCSTWLLAQITAWLGKIETTANATGPEIIIQASIEASGNDWIDILRFTGSTTDATTQALTATEAIAETEIAIAATADFLVGSLIYIKDETGVDESEWGEVVDLTTNTNITLMDGLLVQKVANDDLYTQAERFSVLVDCAGFKRLRACFVHQAATGSAMRVKVTAVGATDIE